MSVQTLIDVKREEWDFEPRPVLAQKPMTRWVGIEVHHGGAAMNGRSVEGTWDAYGKYHRNGKGWSDIWYHLGLHPDGRLYELRGPGASNSSRPYLTVNIPGHGDVDSTDAQFETLHNLRSALVADGGGNELHWHAERGGTMCPGPKVIQRLKAIRAAEKSNGGQLVASNFTDPETNSPMIVDAIGPAIGPFTVPGYSGYYIVGADGGVFALHMPYYGSLPGKVAAHDWRSDPIVGFAPFVELTASKNTAITGYYLRSRNGGIFAFGAAPWHGRVEVVD